MVEIFDRELPDDCKKAITALKKLKVYFAMNDDTIDNFADVCFRVQHNFTSLEYILWLFVLLYYYVFLIWSMLFTPLLYSSF